MKLWRFACATVAIAGSVYAQQPPTLARGYMPGTLSSMSEIEAVNTFNGNLALTVPIGPVYPVSPQLSYQFSLSYNSKSWDFIRRPVWEYPPNKPPVKVYKYEAVPNRRSNAGLGWLFAFGGDLHEPYDPDAYGGFSFESPDGADHGFLDFHHVPDPGGASYSNDGSFLRLRPAGPTGSNRYDVDFPDGTTNEYLCSGICTLIRRRDQQKDDQGEYVNWVKLDEVENSPACTEPGANGAYVISDSHGRTHVVCYGSMYFDDRYKGMPKSFVLEAFAQQSAKYALSYTPDAAIARTCLQSYDIGSPTVVVPLLDSITLPDSSKIEFAYNTSNVAWCNSGTMKSLVLPTGGKYEYDFATWQTVFSNGCPQSAENEYERSWAEKTTGIATKREYDLESNLVATWSYVPAMDGSGETYYCTQDNGTDPIGTPPEPKPNEELSVTVTAPGGRKEVHYYSIWPGFNNRYGDSDNGFHAAEYGLPFTRDPGKMAAGLPLSKEIFDCSTQGNCTLLRQEFVEYTFDDYPGWEKTRTDTNRVPIRTRTVFKDDGDRYVERQFEQYDGFGHARKVTVRGNFGSDTSRVTTTDFHAGTDSAGRTTQGTLGIPASATWVLGRYTTSSVTESTRTATTEVCHDANGRLVGRRVRGTQPAVGRRSDVVVLYQYQNAATTASPFTIREDWYGGDAADATNIDLCASDSGPSSYRIRNEYSFGVPARSTYRNPSTDELVAVIADHTVDRSGLVAKTRDAAGVETSLGYDQLGRVTSVSSPGMAPLGILYWRRGEPGVTRPRVEATVTSTMADNVSVETVEYDGRGRPTSEERSISAGVAKRLLRYDAAGRLDCASEWESTPTFDRSTCYAYDVFGRVLTVAPPNHTEEQPTKQSVAYQGARLTTKTAYVDGVAASTTENYDIHGRLVAVTDALSNTTNYRYDVASRLTSILMGAQTRSLIYDDAGFLREERHPETATITYGGYDARGHLGSRTAGGDPSQYDQAYTYDNAERLRSVSSRMSSTPQFRPFKDFIYADSNDGANLTAGKLTSSVRYHYTPAPIRVEEAYEYRDAAGRRTNKSTTISGLGATPVTTVQSYEYNDLGFEKSVTYPTPAVFGTPNWHKRESTYSHGQLSGITARTFAGSTIPIATLAYWPNGMLRTVAHSNGVTDTYAIDAATGMARPAGISFTNWSDCSAPQITSGPSDAALYYDDTFTLSVFATGSGLAYQWYRDGEAVVGATTPAFSAAARSSGTYDVQVSGNCGKKTSSSATVTVSLRPPAGLLADRAGTAAVQLTWGAVSGATSYQLFGLAGGTWALVGTTATAAFTHQAGADTANVYHVRAAGLNVTPSTPSAAEMESTLSFAAITPGTPVRYADFEEIRRGVNALRAPAGSPPLTWAQLAASCGDGTVPSAGGPVSAAHLMALRCGMDDALSALGWPRPAYTNAVTPGTPIRAIDLNELQSRTDYQGDGR